MTGLTIDPEAVEARPLWKPMHRQPAYAGYEVAGGAVSEALYRDGLCLPSGSAMTEADRDRVCAVVEAGVGGGVGGRQASAGDVARRAPGCKHTGALGAAAESVPGPGLRAAVGY